MLSRRMMLSSTLAATAALASEQVVAQSAKRTIVDAQVHLWKAESDDWKWVPGMKPQLPEPFTIEKLVPLMDEAGVDRVVVVPPSWPGDRNDYGLEAARRYPNRLHVMGRIPLKDPSAAARLPKWREQPGMLGVRVTFLGPAAAWLQDGTADWFWPEAEKAGLPVMFLAPGGIPKFARIAERHPQLTLIIDHMGLNSSSRNNRLTENIPAAIDASVALARYPNVSVKFSGAAGNSLEPYPFRDMTVQLRRLFDAYGPPRCLSATDLTNSPAKE